MSITTEIASTLLGKKVSGSETYDPSILVAVPRYENREQYNIDLTIFLLLVMISGMDMNSRQ